MNYFKGSTRQTLEKVLGRPVDNWQWERMIELGFISPVDGSIDGSQDINWLAKEYRKNWPDHAVKRQPVRPPQPEETKQDLGFSFGEAISNLFAWHAHGDKEVQAFRKDVIGKEMSEAFGRQFEIALLIWKPYDQSMINLLKKQGHKLTKKDIELHDAFTVEAWVKRHAEIEQKKISVLPRRRSEESIEILDYGVPAIPDENGYRAVPVLAGGILDSLRILSERLARTYRWDDAQATLFVLSGGTPWVSRMKAAFDINHEFPAATRIKMTIDPALPPEKVVAFYKECRERILAKPIREPRPKALTLAGYAAEVEIEKGREQADPKRWTWEQKLRGWNRTYGKYRPEWKYEAGQESNFIRDYKSAKEKLLNPPFARAKNLEQKIRFFFDRDFDKLKEGD